MKYSEVHIKHAIATLLLALTVCLQLPLPVQADDIKPLETATPSLDTAATPLVETTPPTGPNTTQPETSTILKGSVKKRGSVTELDGNTTSQDSVPNSSASDSTMQLQPETATADDGQRYQAAITKLKSGAKMTSEDYRSLQIGTCGYIMTQWAWQRHQSVTQVFAGSPAEQAGICKGDVMISSDGPMPTRADWMQSVSDWTHFERPGSKVNVTFKRGKQTLSFTLTRINIEDIQNPKARRMYEESARELPASGEGTVRKYHPGA